MDGVSQIFSPLHKIPATVNLVLLYPPILGIVYRVCLCILPHASLIYIVHLFLLYRKDRVLYKKVPVTESGLSSEESDEDMLT